MSWRIIPTRVMPMCRRVETEMLRRHHPLRDATSNFQRMFDAAWKGFDVESSIGRFEREMERMGRMRSSTRWFEESDRFQHGRNPYVTDEAGNRKLQLQYDVSSYKPEEVSVKMVENRLVVHAKQMKEEAGEKWYAEFSREFTLPKDVNPTEVKSTLSSDGILMVEAPVNSETATAREIPIEFTKAAKDGEAMAAKEGEAVLGKEEGTTKDSS